MRKSRAKPSTDEVAWFGVILGVIGTTVAVLSYCSSQQGERLAKDLEAKQHFYQALDLLGAEPEQNGLRIDLKDAPLVNFKHHSRRLEEIRRLIEKHNMIKPDDPESRFLNLLYWIRTDNIERAQAELREIGKGEIDDSQIYVFTAMHLANRYERNDAANSLFKQAIEENPNDAKAHGAYAFFLHTLNKNRESIALLRKAITLAPNDISLRNGLAHVLLESGDVIAAEGLLVESIKEGLVDGDTHNTLGAVYSHERKFDLAIEHFKKAIELSPKEAIYHRNLGLLYKKTNKNDEAQRKFAEAAKY